MDCKCDICTSACQKRPGWFAPGEVAKAAVLKGMTEQEFFDKYICVDYFANDENSIFVLAPGTTRATPGQEYPFNPHGQCVFFKNGLCDIHDAKPNECRFYDHATPNDVCMENRNGIVEAWRQNRQEIVTLLKREPKLPPPNMGEVVEMLFDIMKGF